MSDCALSTYLCCCNSRSYAFCTWRAPVPWWHRWWPVKIPTGQCAAEAAWLWGWSSSPPAGLNVNSKSKTLQRHQISAVSPESFLHIYIISKQKSLGHRHRVFLQYFCVTGEALTGDSRDETQGPQHSEGSQCLHVKPPSLLHWHTCYLIDGIQGKSEETVGKDCTTVSA